MASTTDRKKRRSSSTKKKKAAAPLVSSQRKKEILGLILMVLALLIALAVITYSPEDDALARRFSLDAMLDPGNNRANNALGLIGAALAYLLVPQFLGYTVLLFPCLLFAWGYVLFRNKTPLYLPLLTMLIGIATIILAAFFGWLGLTLDADLNIWSGIWGLGIAGWMQRVFGSIGSLILLLLILSVTVLLLIDHDIQRTLDRAEEAFKKIRRQLQQWFTDKRVDLAERKEERALLLEERRKQRAQDRKEREQKPRPVPAAKRETPSPKQAQQQATEKITRLRPQASVPTPPPASVPVTPPPPPVPPVPVSETPDGEESPHDLELKVRARIEEEKADVLDHVVDTAPVHIPFEMPDLDLLDEDDENAHKIDFEELEENKQVLLDKLATYNIEITDINAVVGPTVTLYELSPAPGVKISRITALEDDLAMAMAARGIRMIAPIPGKSAIGVEIPNRHRELVRIRDVIGTAKFRDADMELPLIIGKSIEGEVILKDLTKMPHFLIAGATGSGKSVGLNTFITGLLYACHPSSLKFVMIDPKRIELQPYARIANHYVAMTPDSEDAIITDFSQALGALKSCEKEMESRYDLLSKARVRGIKEYNVKFKKGDLSKADGHRHLPYIVVVVDELADLMMTAGKDIEGPIARLAQMARAIGIHLILATQRPSVDVITGLIKANFPARIAYQVASKIDSRTILDTNGAEGLVGNGDLLYMKGSRMMRLQGPFVSIEEVDHVTSHIGNQKGQGIYELPPTDTQDATGESSINGSGERDSLFEDAARVIVRSQQGSVSLLQRKLSVGYSRAARIVDQLEDAGIVGPFEGSKARQVLVADDMQLDQLLNDL